jgi:AN1-type zinc finger and ubiquitin domain-containing protein 1
VNDINLSFFNLSGTSSTIQKKKKKDSVRCSECRKRIGVACRYQCRCGRMFCAIHRYAEAHTCTFDYKTEGRKQLQEANPVVVASKVDKI